MAMDMGIPPILAPPGIRRARTVDNQVADLGFIHSKRPGADTYLIDLCATQAAIRAGYSAKTAAEIGHQNLRKLQVAEAIEKAQAKRAERVELTVDWVIDEL